MVELQEKVSNQWFGTPEVRDYSLYVEVGGAAQESRRLNSTSREREVVMKGIERMEKQIKQLINVFISREQVDIALLKKCKTVDVPAVNSAIGNINELFDSGEDELTPLQLKFEKIAKDIA